MSGEISFRKILRDELESRVAANARYSMRAFARDLGLHPGRLSAIMAGKEGLSSVRAQQIGKRLGWSSDEVRYFCDLVDSEHARSETRRALAKSRLQQRILVRGDRIRLETFRVIADWQHLALRELVRTKDFRLDFPKLAKALSLPIAKVRETWRRLEDLELVWKDEEGRWQTSDLVLGPDGLPSVAVRRYQQQILEKAVQALGNDFDECHFSSIVFPCAKEKLALAHEMIRQFRQEAGRKLESTASSEVFALSVQMFRVAGMPSETSTKEKP